MFHKLLGAYFAAFIFLWFLGIDQLFFLILCCVGLFTFIATPKVSPGKEVIFFAIFVLVTFVSVFQISTGIGT